MAGTSVTSQLLVKTSYHTVLSRLDYCRNRHLIRSLFQLCPGVFRESPPGVCSLPKTRPRPQELSQSIRLLPWCPLRSPGPAGCGAYDPPGSSSSSSSPSPPSRQSSRLSSRRTGGLSTNLAIQSTSHHYLSPRHSFGPKALYIDSLISSQVVTSSTPTCPPHYFMKLAAESLRPQTATACAPRTSPAGLGCGNQAPSATSWQQWVTWRVLASGAQLDFPLVVILYNNMFSVTNIFILYVTETGRTF